MNNLSDRVKDVILGETGVNFAAGMSGGIAYVQDKINKQLTI